MSGSNNDSTIEEFGPIKKLIWPIHNYELKKFLPLGFIMFCILFNYTLLRDTKDTLVVNAAGAGAISFLKFYCVTPSAVLFVIFYAKLTNMFSREAVFYAVVSPFLIFFGLFAFLIYPNIDLLHPSEGLIRQLHLGYPRLGGFIDIFAYWSYSLFYVLSEIWGSAMIALMFWQFANHVVRMSESKRFYGLFVVIGNVALIFSGKAVKFFSLNIKNYYPGYTDAEIWGFSLNWLMGSVVVMGILAMVIYRWMHTNVLNDKKYFDPAEKKSSATKKKKSKPSLMDSLKLILHSKELLLIATLVMAYGVTINLVELQWKNQLKLFCAGDKGLYNGFMGDFSFYTGIITIIFSLLVGANVLRIMSWFKAAVITPAFILLGGSLFFCFILSTDLSFIKEFIHSMLISIKSNPITAATFLGAGIVLMSKSIKYSLFDPTKEMAYIPLDDELKTKGKAAVDVIGGRAGKAGGAFIQSSLLTIAATRDVIIIAPITFVLFIIVCLCWVFSVKVLSKSVKQATALKAKNESQNNLSAGMGNSNPNNKTTQPA